MSDINDEILRQRIKQAKTPEDAREFAIEWQQNQSNTSMTWEDVAMWNAIFRELAEQYDLVEEFTENGII